jgi:hypothetical protein
MGLWSRLLGGTQPQVDAERTIFYRVGVDEKCRNLAQRFHGDGQQWERIFRDNERVLQERVQSGGDPLSLGTEVVIRGARYGIDG